MSKQLFDRDNFTGVTEFIGKNDKGQTVIQKNQDVKSIIAENRYELNSHIENNWKGDMHKVASIPLIIVDMWREELKAKGAHDCDPLSTNNRNFLIAKINSSEWSALRTKQGRV
jgi:hypothetical protein